MGGRVGGWGPVGDFRVDVNREVHFFVKKILLGGWGGQVGGGVFGVGGSQGGCEHRIEVFVKNSKKKWGGGAGVLGGWVGGGGG